MTYSKLFISLSLIFIFSLSSCSKEDEKTGFELRIGVDQSVANYREAGDLQFNDGFITIREIVFDGDLTGSSSVSITHQKVIKFDFATGIGDPADEIIEIPAGDYNDIYLGIELQDENDDPTLVLEGTYEKEDGNIYPLRFEFNSGEVFEAEATSASVAPGTTAISKITFNPHDWFANVSFNQLENSVVNNDGVIVISEESNSNIFDLVADGLDMSTEAKFN